MTALVGDRVVGCMRYDLAGFMLLTALDPADHERHVGAEFDSVATWNALCVVRGGGRARLGVGRRQMLNFRYLNNTATSR